MELLHDYRPWSPEDTVWLINKLAHGQCKFVAIQGERDAIASIFYGNQHALVALRLQRQYQLPEKSFLGAGLVWKGADINAIYHSTSCSHKDAYGRDKPDDASRAEQLLEEFKRKVTETLGDVI